MFRTAMATAALLALVAPANAAFDIQVGNTFQHTLLMTCDAAAVLTCQKAFPTSPRPLRVDFMSCDIVTDNAAGAGVMNSVQFFRAANTRGVFSIPMKEYAVAITGAAQRHSYTGSEPIVFYMLPNNVLQASLRVAPASKITGQCTISGTLL